MGTRGISVSLWLVAASTLAPTAWSQTPQTSPPQSCAQVLASPTRDSVLLRVMLTVHAFDRDRDLPESIQFDFGEAVRRHLVLPQPLGVDTYESSVDTNAPRTARLTLRGNYAATLTAEGRIIKATATGGARNPEFDTAVLTAMRSIDSTDQLSPAGGGLPREDVRIRVEIAARDTATKSSHPRLEAIIAETFNATRFPDGARKPEVPSFAPMPSDSATEMPLFSFRVPVRAVTGRLMQIPGIGGVRYPSSRRQPGTSGQAELSFVVDVDGVPEEASIQVVNATQREYAAAALDAMPKFRYRPLEVNGCRVRAFAEEPFRFFMEKVAP
jgi:TonB family protein